MDGARPRLGPWMARGGVERSRPRRRTVRSHVPHGLASSHDDHGEHRARTRATPSRYASASTTNADRKPVQLIDIGANLTHDSFAHDRDTVLKRARDAGGVKMVVTGASRAHSPQPLARAPPHPGEPHTRKRLVMGKGWVGSLSPRVSRNLSKKNT